MINVDEEALICDLAETYHIYDYRSLPLSRVAIFAVGLRENSRIKMKMNDVEYTFEQTLLAAIKDHLAAMVWLNTEDGAKGVNRPQSLVARMLEREEERDTEAFDSPQAFLEQWEKIINGGT